MKNHKLGLKYQILWSVAYNSDYLCITFYIYRGMKSILERRPSLKAEIDKVAEVAGYLWQNGWAERNGGNITVNVTAYAAGNQRCEADWCYAPCLEGMLFLL